MFLGSNIKILRTRMGLTQEVIANEFGITRSTLNNYENTIVVNPTAEILVTISTYFNVSIDNLLKTDLSKFSDKQIEDLTKGYDVYTTGTKIRVLATTVDSKNNDNNDHNSNNHNDNSSNNNNKNGNHNNTKNNNNSSKNI
jgi:transcriptional regulator with XRE-family HTH domain